MKKYITDETTGIRYELVGNLYVIAGDDEPFEIPVGRWGAGVRWTPLPKAEAPTEPTGETKDIMTTSKIIVLICILNFISPTD